MSTDYDAPRTKDTEDVVDESLEALAVRRRGQADVAVLEDDDDAGETLVLPDGDLSGEELTVRVIPKQADEFTCSSCFLVHHHSRLALRSGDRMVCSDCV
ncbi:DUF4193 domain-containing protein [Mycolicibacterium sp. XJ1819]